MKDEEKRDERTASVERDEYEIALEAAGAPAPMARRIASSNDEDRAVPSSKKLERPDKQNPRTSD